MKTFRVWQAQLVGLNVLMEQISEIVEPSGWFANGVDRQENLNHGQKWPKWDDHNLSRYIYTLNMSSRIVNRSTISS
jgi:hypothetical protein